MKQFRESVRKRDAFAFALYLWLSAGPSLKFNPTEDSDVVIYSMCMSLLALSSLVSGSVYEAQGVA